MSLKLDANEIKNFIESFGCKMIGQYKSVNHSFEILCNCNTKYTTNFKSFKKSKYKSCKKCIMDNTKSQLAFNIYKIKQSIEKFDCKLLSFQYENAYTPLKLQCKCGEQWITNWRAFNKSKYKSCKICSAKLQGKQISGNKSYLYGLKGKLNPNFTNEQRNALAKKFRSPEYIEMRQKVLHRDKCTCAKCYFTAKFKIERRKLNIHHLFSKEQYPQWFYKISNLITLCSKCHKNFHKTFGYRNNKPSQMKIYLERV